MKLEVGMYVRTKWGIARLTGECWEDFGGDTAYAVDCCLLPIGETKIFKEDIIGEPSHSIIDLIEVGDYVNGSLVVDKWEEPDWYGYFIKLEGEETIPTIRKIETIVTKEQFESMSYKVKE